MSRRQNDATTRRDTLKDVAAHLREELKNKKHILLFAYNGTGKTRLSMAFKEIGKRNGKGDTLYYNAFTEDLFGWNNDLDGDGEHTLKLNVKSSFFAGLEEFEMDTRIRQFLDRHADFDFRIDPGGDEWVVRFSREARTEEGSQTADNIKVSRGEENIFIWCFFLAVVQLAMDKDIEAYSWVKYIYIDDPISSLDENNAVAVGHHLAQLLKDEQNPLKTVISSHHALFFNVMCNELKNANKYFLSGNKITKTYKLKDTGDTPFFYHVAMLAELREAARTGDLYTHHFNMLRVVLEKTASFHGYKKFSSCIGKDDGDPDGTLRARTVNILNHGNYSLYEPREMLPENKDLFKKTLDGFLRDHRFNTELFPEFVEGQEDA